MELSDYFRILRTHGWIIVVVIAVAAASAFGFSKLQRPIYKSSMQVIVLPARNDLGLAQTTKQLLRAYVAHIDTKDFAKLVLDHFEKDNQPLDMTPGQLKGNVTIASYEDKNVVQIDMKDGDGEQANRIAWAWANEFQYWRNLENAKVRKEDQVEVLLGDYPSYTKFRPQTTINTVAGGIFGALLGVLIVAALEWLESGIVRTLADVERKLGLAVLGATPISDRLLKLNSKSALITLTHPDSPAAEAYWALRANLYLASIGHPLRTLVVTSAVPGEDNPATLANLAVVMAQGGQHVILVDADMRRPSLHELFEVPNERGLITLLNGQDAPSAPPLVAIAEMEGLQLLTSGLGPLHPAAQFCSRRMDEVIAALQERADVLLLAAPPVLPVMDTVVLGVKTDGVLLVVQVGHTSRDHLQQARERLEKAHVRIVGVMLSRAVADSSLGVH